MYAIVDIETTGGSSRSDKITEIAIYIHDGDKIVEEYATLINPERSIPYHITQITGINDDTVRHAPKFYEVAKRIIELTENTIFVAHNVGFDYGFVRNEFKTLGFQYEREQLCTVKLSRKAFPGHQSYSLGKICKAIGIVIEDRHRAAGDALATVTLFQHILKAGAGDLVERTVNKGISKADLSPHLDPEILRKLPEECGVYYFYNDVGDVIYIGKSKNIKSRVYQHLRNSGTSKANKMRLLIAAIDFSLTGSELIALLKESHEIKQFRPIFNRAQKRHTENFAIVADYDLFGYIKIAAKKPGKYDDIVVSFGKQSTAEEKLYQLTQKFELCQKLTGLEGNTTDGACFHYHLKQCRGACKGEEDFDAYNARAQAALDHLQFRDQNFILIDEGRRSDERAIVVVERGRYLGYGYAETAISLDSTEALKDQIESFPDNRDVRSIIKGFLTKVKRSQIIQYSPQAHE